MRNNQTIILKTISIFGMLIVLLGLTSVHAQHPSAIYLQRAGVVHDHIYKEFYDSSKQLFKEKTVLRKDERPYSYLWPLCALVQAANEMEVLDHATDYMGPVDRAIAQYYSPSKPPSAGYDSYVAGDGGGDRFYDDNQWIGLAYTDAYQRTKKPTYLQMATTIYRFMLTGYDTVSGGGMYWQEFHNNSKNTCSNGPGILLALQLYRSTHEKKYIDTAILLYNWVNARLQSPDGLYFDALKLPSGKIDERKYTYNTGTMLQSAVLLHQLTGKDQYLSQAKSIAEQSARYFFKDGLLPGNYWFNAVLMRGYVELYKIDKQQTYMQLFKKYLDAVWDHQRDEQGLIGTKQVKTLLDQAGYLEMLARMAAYFQSRD
ncbi:Glycosyl hydrolase family 76 [Hydrobacter penzbergensis]|uniref:Glycosyl hydrolase family 76 n=1 Tax=Hydrobacter penzbergensis TaxID=1235997 RepID=A0A8X8IGQ1_9BACT|nr:glycoside hydrolase family 76 protein [Hydrobacter penzbergensis]SDX22122.1 Glycosyl hydrolase family 76 [Hydrobacter penzbergensis]